MKPKTLFEKMRANREKAEIRRWRNGEEAHFCDLIAGYRALGPSRVVRTGLPASVIQRLSVSVGNKA